ncbi:hypothetical protein PHMEG_0008789 [Phytophthora megakarya]|uniref:CCHC-type domain-containing protein n=1 Tax=Phytophthora megakarya TaxID=4795 RepID=A0A225WI95_9STRA|nr:hypothetical protein PHMEG_0008789 [Phytophthora megakarya]
MRRMMPGETQADFEAGLRDMVGRNRVSERVLLAYFYRNLNKTTKPLVNQHPKLRTLEEAVEKATEIDNPMDNVAQGMMNIGESRATAPSRYFVPMDGTTGQTSVIPGVSGTGIGAFVSGVAEHGLGGMEECQAVALFTNCQSVYNAYSGHDLKGHGKAKGEDGVTYGEVPGCGTVHQLSGRVQCVLRPRPERTWNGKYWAEQKVKTARPQARKTVARSKPRREVVTSSGDETDDNPQTKKLKAAVKQTVGDDSGRYVTATAGGRQSAGCTNGPNCYACGKFGHISRDCSDAAAKALNDEYLAKREQAHQELENASRAT